MAQKLWHHRGQMSEAFRTVMFLSASGGLQDAYTYIGRGKVFANAQTGNIVLMSQAAFDGDLARVLHWRQLVLVVEILLLFGVGFIPNTLDMAANALVSFACAMQVQAFRKVHGYPFASTMCIGNLRSGMESLVVYLHLHDKKVLYKALHYFGVILLFAIGAGLGAQGVAVFGNRTIWFSCALLLVSLCFMFIQDEEQARRETE